MFAKVAQFRAVGPHRAAPSAAAPVHCNDNRIAARGCAAMPRTRPVLACRWRRGADGRLECHWQVEISGGTATADPYPRWIIEHLRQVFGIATAGGRLAMPATA
jgi:hypothetical protein